MVDYKTRWGGKRQNKSRCARKRRALCKKKEKTCLTTDDPEGSGEGNKGGLRGESTVTARAGMGEIRKKKRRENLF